MSDVSSEGAVSGLARLLALSSRLKWQELPLAVLGVAFDASTDKTNNWLSVGGFISSAGDWEDFDGLWKARLKRDGLTFFRMADFAHSFGEFSHGWKDNEPRRRALLGDLLDLIESHAYRKVGFMVELKGYTDLPNVKDLFGSTAFATTAFIAISGAYNWCLETFRTVPHVFFEEGDASNSSLNAALDKWGVPRPTYMPKVDDPKTGRLGFTPIQPGDMLAYEMTKVTSAQIGPDGQVLFRHPFDRFNRMPGDAKCLDATALPSLDEIARSIKFLGGPKP